MGTVQPVGTVLASCLITRRVNRRPVGLKDDGRWRIERQIVELRCAVRQRVRPRPGYGVDPQRRSLAERHGAPGLARRGGGSPARTVASVDTIVSGRVDQDGITAVATQAAAYLRYVRSERGAFQADLLDPVGGPFASLAVIVPMLLAELGGHVVDRRPTESPRLRLPGPRRGHRSDRRHRRPDRSRAVPPRAASSQRATKPRSVRGTVASLTRDARHPDSGSAARRFVGTVTTDRYPATDDA
jgi:hypothetical protein